MFQSARYSQVAIRIGLALVFFWFGISKFVMPQYWIDAWMPMSVQHLVALVHLAPKDFIFLNAIFEVLVGVSLASGFFMRWFAGIAVFFLITVLVLNGFTEVTIRDVGLMGALIALIIWPERAYI